MDGALVLDLVLGGFVNSSSSKGDDTASHPQGSFTTTMNPNATSVTTPPTTQSPQPKPSTLEQIRQEGVFRVIGYDEVFPFYYTNQTTGEMMGVEYSFVKAVAAAILGDDDPKIEVISDVPSTNIFNALASGYKGGHILARTVTWNMERQILEASSNTGFANAGTYTYDGTRMGGLTD